MAFLCCFIPGHVYSVYIFLSCMYIVEYQRSREIEALQSKSATMKQQLCFNQWRTATEVRVDAKVEQIACNVRMYKVKIINSLSISLSLSLSLSFSLSPNEANVIKRVLNLISRTIFHCMQLLKKQLKRSFSRWREFSEQKQTTLTSLSKSLKQVMDRRRTSKTLMIWRRQLQCRRMLRYTKVVSCKSLLY